MHPSRHTPSSHPHTGLRHIQLPIQPGNTLNALLRREHDKGLHSRHRVPANRLRVLHLRLRTPELADAARAAAPRGLRARPRVRVGSRTPKPRGRAIPPLRVPAPRQGACETLRRRRAPGDGEGCR